MANMKVKITGDQDVSLRAMIARTDSARLAVEHERPSASFEALFVAPFVCYKSGHMRKRSAHLKKYVM